MCIVILNINGSRYLLDKLVECHNDCPENRLSGNELPDTNFYMGALYFSCCSFG